jgi:hypothetical protein
VEFSGRAARAVDLPLNHPTPHATKQTGWTMVSMKVDWRNVSPDAQE